MNAQAGPTARAATPAGKGGGTASPAPGQGTMQATVQDRYGSADVLRLKEIGRPGRGSGCCCVSRRDWFSRPYFVIFA